MNILSFAGVGGDGDPLQAKAKSEWSRHAEYPKSRVRTGTPASEFEFPGGFDNTCRDFGPLAFLRPQAALKRLGAYAENYDRRDRSRYHEPDREEYGRPVRLLAELEAERAVSKLLAEALLHAAELTESCADDTIGTPSEVAFTKCAERYRAALAKYREGL